MDCIIEIQYLDLNFRRVRESSQAVICDHRGLIYPHFPVNKIVSLAIQLTYHAIATFAT
jgi:hypothetical protein